MESDKKHKILRIYLSNTDKIKHTSVYEAIAFKARKYGLAGTTVYKGVMGYGTSSELHFTKFWELTEKIPIVIEIIDEESKIADFIEKLKPWLELNPKGCLMTCQDVEIILHKRGKNR